MVLEAMIAAVLGAFVPTVADDLVVEEEPLCDDGSNAWTSDGRPNWSCTIEGCGPSEAICWDYRLDDCLSDDGTDLGVCVRGKESTCSGVWACFDLWLYCDGVYRCHESDGVGCKSGSCTPRMELDPNVVIQP